MSCERERERETVFNLSLYNESSSQISWQKHRSLEWYLAVLVNNHALEDRNSCNHTKCWSVSDRYFKRQLERTDDSLSLKLLLNLCNSLCLNFSYCKKQFRSVTCVELHSLQQDVCHWELNLAPWLKVLAVECFCLKFEMQRLLCSSHKRFPSTGSCAEPGGSSSLQNSPIRSLPHWNSQSSMPSTPDLRVRSPHSVHSTR